MENNKIVFKERQTELWVYPKINNFQDKIEDKNEFLSFLDCENDSKKPIKLYVHFPFCESFCVFCPYYKERYSYMSEEQKDEYFNAVVKEIEKYGNKELFSEYPINVIYFGGGDPACVELKYLKKVFNAIENNFDISKIKSFTMEGSINSLWDIEKLRWFKSVGGTRVSFGVQTFNTELRNKLNLKKSEVEIYKLGDLLRENGIEDFTIDMMYNFPDQTIEDVIIDAKKACKLQPSCIDIHNCNVYPNTVFSKIINEGKIFNTKPTNESEIEMYHAYVDSTSKEGYKQIGPIFFAKEYKKVKYEGLDDFLRGNPHLGIGPSSRSYLNKRSFRNICSIEEYIKLLNSEGSAIEAGNIATKEEDEERAMVFFPIMGWIDRKYIPDNKEIWDKIKLLVESGYLELDDNELRLVGEGFVYAGNVAEYFTGKNQTEKYLKGFLQCLTHGVNPYNQDKMGVSKK